MSTKPKTGKTEETKDDIESFLTELYNTSILTEDEVKSWYEEISYQGFDRKKVLADLKKIIPQIDLIVRLIILIAVRGPQKASGVKLPNGKTASEMGIHGGGGKGSKNLTCGKIGAATADLAAFYLKKFSFPKRINMDLPGWLQFPAAGSIRLPQIYREQHREFSIKFSKHIGGEFNEQIYEQMVVNSYINDKLNLF
jgi:hypothetical protein